MPPLAPIVAALLLATDRATDPPIVDRAPLPAEGVERAAAAIADRTNAFRKDEGRGTLQENPELTTAARDFAEFMARTGRYGHDADGRQPADRAATAGYRPCVVAENIAWLVRSSGFTEEQLADGLTTGWKESPGHRKNMLDQDVTEIGVAVARSAESGKYYGVQLFGRPKRLAFEFRVENRTEKPVEYTLGGKPQSVAGRTVQTHTACVPAEVRFAGAELATVTGGERFVVEADGDGVKVKRE